MGMLILLQVNVLLLLVSLGGLIGVLTGHVAVWANSAAVVACLVNTALTIFVDNDEEQARAVLNALKEHNETRE